MATTIKLNDVLKYLDYPEEVDKPFLFVNPSEQLETFFRYKANLKEIFKLQLKLQMHPEEEKEIENEVNSAIEIGMKTGNWLVFHLGSSPDFSIVEFLKKFKFYDKDMCKPSKIKDKNYALEKGILRKENDVDVFGNKGCLQIMDKFKFCFLTTCDETKVDQLLKANSEWEFNVIIVK